MKTILPGMRFVYQGGNSITPIPHHVTVVWDDGENVHYRTDTDPGKVRQTPRERFIEITQPDQGEQNSFFYPLQASSPRLVARRIHFKRGTP